MREKVTVTRGERVPSTLPLAPGYDY
jgi:hypothetical protein